MNIDKLELEIHNLYLKYDLESNRPSWFEVIQKGRYKEKQIRVNLLGYTEWGSTINCFAIEDTYSEAFEKVLPLVDLELARISAIKKQRSQK